MDDVTTTAERGQRTRDLEQFANAKGVAQPGAPMVRPVSSMVERVIGAQECAVYRDETKVLAKLKALAAAAGTDWFYRFPVRSKGGEKTFIEGPSIKLANDVARIYGNCVVEVREIDVGDAWVFYARFTDIETGFSTERAYRQRKSQRAMNTDNDRALDIAYQIGQSKAIRNVIVNGLQTFADYAFEEARNSLVEKIGKDLPGWRDRMLKAIERIPVDLLRVEKVIGRAAKDWLAPDIAKIFAMGKSITDGMATIDETFPPLDAKPESGTTETDAATTGASEGATAASDAPSRDSSSSQAPTPAAGQPAPDSSASSQATAGVTANVQASGAGTAQQDYVPTTVGEYVGYANAWIERATDPAAAEAKWKGEKNLRNKCNVDSETREELKAALDAKLADLAKAKG